MPVKLCLYCKERKAYTKFCSFGCYYAYRRSPTVIVARFWEHVTKGGPDECWPFDIHANPEGYRDFVYRRGTNSIKKGAHVFAYFLANQKFPEEGMFVCHTCDNPPCVNIKHLFLGTAQDNVTDMLEKGRGSYYPGENSRYHKFDNGTVLLCRKMRREGYGVREIGRQVGMSPQNVSDICNYKIWAHIK